MMIQLPKPIQTYYDATNAADREAFLAAFAQDAVVIDEGTEKCGHEAIRAWGEKSHFADNLSLAVTRAIEKDGQTIVTAKADGDFDKTGLPDPCLLDFAFTLDGDKIKRLEIVLSSSK